MKTLLLLLCVAVLSVFLSHKEGVTVAETISRPTTIKCVICHKVIKVYEFTCDQLQKSGNFVKVHWWHAREHYDEPQQLKYGQIQKQLEDLKK